MGCQESSLNNTQNSMQRKSFRKKMKNEGIHGSAQSNIIYENINSIQLVKEDEDVEMINSAISKHFLLYKLGKNQRKQLIKAMEGYEAQEGSYVFQQNTLASMFFIIRTGKITIEINNQYVRTIEKGDYFGELALIFSAPRSASVKASTNCTFWCLKQFQFHKILKEMVKNNFKIARPLVNKLPLFNFLSKNQKENIAYHMNTFKFKKDEIIFKEGQNANSFYIIIDGAVSIDIPGKEKLVLQSGECFGQSCLRKNAFRSGNAYCLQKCQLLTISSENLKFCLGQEQDKQEILFYNIIKWSLKRSTLLNNLEQYEQDRLIEQGQILIMDDKEQLGKWQDIKDYIYIVLEGKVNNYDVGTIFNEKSIEGIEEIIEDDLVKVGDGHVYRIQVKKAERIYKRIGKYGLKKHNSNKTATTEKYNKQQRRLDCKILLSDLIMIKKLGQGQMGKVVLVQNRKTLERFALKCVQKNFVIKHKMEKFIQGEKQLLLQCNFPLLVELNQTYRDEHFVYLLLSYIEGGDFFDFLNEVGCLSDQQAKFYIGCFILCIQYLHKKQIIYRDIKPQNAALDSRGYLKMIDLGTAKSLNQHSQQGLRTFTIIGTPHYMAPQILEAKGYSFSVDIWSIGIVMYEILFGVLPFGSNNDNAMTIYENIQKNEIAFPKKYKNQEGKKFIMRCLEKNSIKRSVSSFSTLKNMPYFDNFSWKDLEYKNMKPPIMPKIQNHKHYKGQNFSNFIQKQKSKMQRPFIPNVEKWDECF